VTKQLRLSKKVSHLALSSQSDLLTVSEMAFCTYNTDRTSINASQ